VQPGQSRRRHQAREEAEKARASHGRWLIPAPDYGLRVIPALVTAGATRNPVDAIRYLSAGATGSTGLALARALAPTHDVLLLGSAEACLRADGSVPCEEFGSTRDLMARMERLLWSRPGGVLVHSAAVGDYEAEALATKIPSGQPELVIRLRPGPKIVDHVRTWDPAVFLVSFKAGSPEWSDDKLLEVATAQRARTRSDLVFANRLGDLDRSCAIVASSGVERFTSRDSALSRLVERIRLRA